MRLLVGCDLGGGCCGSCVGTVRFKQFGEKVHIKMGPNGYISMLISIDYFIHDMTSIHATLCLFQRWLLKPSIVAPCVCEDWLIFIQARSSRWRPVSVGRLKRTKRQNNSPFYFRSRRIGTLCCDFCSLATIIFSILKSIFTHTWGHDRGFQ